MDEQQQQHEFTIHEFDALREEINGYFTEMRKLEVYAVVATAVVYSFLVALEKGGNNAMAFRAPLSLWALPIAFPVLILIRGWAFHNQVRMIGAYIESVEQRYGRTPLGWENRTKHRFRENFLTVSNLLFIVVLAGFSIWLFYWRLHAAAAVCI